MLKLEARPQLSRFWSYGSPILALAITVLIGVLLFMLLGKDPVKGLLVFFWEPIKSGYALGELMVKATPLLVIALGLAVCFRSNVWNIGAEGQYIIGAVCAGGVALLADKATGGWIVIPVVLAGAGCAVLVVSEELEELFEICDRLVVMAKGRLSPSLPRNEASTELVGQWMSGLWEQVQGVSVSEQVAA